MPPRSREGGGGGRSDEISFASRGRSFMSCEASRPRGHVSVDLKQSVASNEYFRRFLRCETNSPRLSSGTANGISPTVLRFPGQTGKAKQRTKRARAWLRP